MRDLYVKNNLQMKKYYRERKNNNIIKPLNNLVIDLPAPSNISYIWNYGRLLGLILFTQIITGLFLSIHYNPSIYFAFERVIHITRDVNRGWILRFIHINGASLFFLFIYIHLYRGIYYNSYIKLKKTWIIGTTIIITTIGIAFIGYVLPWGQISFWGATVITNLLSAIPYIGKNLVNWIWGGFSVDNPTLNRFFIFHFILPFILMVLVFLHLITLHDKESRNPLGIIRKMDKIPFHPYFRWKDSITFIISFTILIIISLLYPFYLGDPENFIQANPLVTPIHIQPEWYFLFAYAILRSIPNKLGGVLAFVLSVSSFYFLPILRKNQKMQSNQFIKFHKILTFLFIFNIILLTWIGARPVEQPFILLGQLLTLSYFSFFILKPFIK